MHLNILKGKSFFISPSVAFYFWRWLILILFGSIIYYQTLGYDFVFDDDWFIVTNVYIRDWAHISNVFLKLPKTRLIGIYSFALNYQINGLNPWGYHLFNLMVHMITVGMVWGLSSLILRIAGYLPFKAEDIQASNKKPKEDKSLKIYKDIPFLVALLFLVHPCQIQAVTYITQRFESMATLFYISSVYCYLLARTSVKAPANIAYFVGSFTLAVMGIMTKEVVVTIPLTLIAAELILLNKNNEVGDFLRKKIFSKENKVWVLGSLIFIGSMLSLFFMKLVRADLRIFFQNVTSESHDWDVFTPVTYFLTQMHVFLTFARLLIFPVNQNLDYDYPMSTGLLSPPLTIVGAFLIGLIIYLVFRYRKNLPLISFGLAWMLITFLINLAPRANAIFEHKLYLISFGFFLAVLSTIAINIRSRIAFLSIVGVIVVILSVLSFQRNQIWKDDVTLWEDVVQKSPHKKRVMANMGLAYSRAKRYDEALTVFNRFMVPSDMKSYLARGQIYFEIGEEEKALKDFNYVISQDALNADAYIRRAKVYKRLNEFDAALSDLNQAIQIESDNEKALLDRGVLWMALGKPKEALKDLQYVLLIDPKNYGALVDSAGVFFVTKQYDRALEQLNKAILAGPRDLKAYQNRAFCFLAMGRTFEALQDIEYYLRFKPNDPMMNAKHLEIKSLLRLP